MARYRNCNVFQVRPLERPLFIAVSLFDFIVQAPGWLVQFHRSHPETLLNRSKALGVAIASAIF